MSPVAAMIAAIALPLLGIAGTVLWGERHRNMREATTLLTATLTFLVVTTLIDDVMAGGRPTVVLGQLVPGIELAFSVEPLGLLFALIASGLWIVTTLYAIGYMREHHEKNQTRFYAFFAVSIAATLAIAFAANMATLFVAYELLTLATFPLVTHHGTETAKRGGRTYLGILIGTSIVFQLLAIAWTWAAAGTLDFTQGGIMEGKIDEGFVIVLLLLYVFGVGKAAVMPFHRWLPAAMVAPTPVSALLHAVAVVKAGVFTVIKVVVYIFGLEFLQENLAEFWGGNGLVYIAGFTILAASLIALRQDNLKRRLAYSTISQLSYVVLAAAILTPVSLTGAALHIAAHAFGKITLFFAAGAILVASHKTNVSQLNGIGRRMPWTMGAFTIGALSMIGVPPTAGFISKWFILGAAMDSETWAAVAVIIVSTLLNAAYFLPIVYAAFFKPETTDDHHGHGEAPVLSVVALCLTAAGSVLLFFAPELPLALAQQMAEGF